MKEMGEAGREFVRENFLLTRNLRDYLALLFTIRSGRGEHVVSL
jgi:trehalose synthase